MLTQLPFYKWGENEIRSLSYTTYEVNSRCIKDLNLTYKTLQLLEGLGEYPNSLKQGKEIRRRALQAEELERQLADTFIRNMESNTTMESNNTVVVRFKYVMFLEQYLRHNLLTNVSFSQFGSFTY